MHRKMSALFALLIITAAGPAMAQTNPLGGLLGALKSLGHHKQDVQDKGSPELTGLLKTYSISSVGFQDADQACNQLQHYDSRSSDEALFKQRNYMGAAAGFRLHATTVAACAVGSSGSPTLQRIPLTQAYIATGRDLAMSAIASRLANAVVPETEQMAKDALTLLNYDTSANSTYIDELHKSGLLGPAPEPTPTEGTAVAMSAKDAVAAYKANTFAFKLKHAGKALRVSGQIQQIYGDSKGATVTLVGFKPANMDDQGYQDVVRCTVSDQDALPRVADLSTGKTATVVGAYEPDHQVMPVGIELKNCRIQ